MGIISLVRYVVCFFFDLLDMLILGVELRKYHCAESYYGTAGGGEDAGLCSAWYSVAVQGLVVPLAGSRLT